MSAPSPGDHEDAGPGAAPATPDPPDGEVARLQEEQARLQAEVDALRAQLATTPRRPSGRPRRIVAAALVVLTVIVFTVAGSP